VLTHNPQPMHRSISRTAFLSLRRIASIWHRFVQRPHPLHALASRRAQKGLLTTLPGFAARLRARSIPQQQPQQVQMKRGSFALSG
jgi:hypothetical protein